MKKYIKIVAIIASFALIPLQYFLLKNVYKGLEKNLFVAVDDSFKAAVEEEVMIRYRNLEGGVSYNVNKSGKRFNQEILTGVNEILERYNISINLDTLQKIFVSNLNDKGLYNLKFKIIKVSNDTTYFSNVEDFISDNSYGSLRELSTTIIPISSDFSKGLRAVIKNPYKLLFSNMKWLLILSFIVVFIVLFGLYKISNILSKVTRINKLRKDHTYAMVHDMKTPLAAINLVAEDLKENRDLVNNSDFTDDIKILEEEANHLNEICDRVINVAKLESKKLKFVYEEIELESFVQSLITKYIGIDKEKKRTKEVSITTDFSSKKFVCSDRLYLKEILDNIIDNSIKYSGEKVDIEIFSKLNKRKNIFNFPGLERLNLVSIKQYVELHIKDNGVGISDSNKKRLFKKFERGENTIAISGHGIGLNYVYQLMKHMGGYVKIESKLGLFTEVIIGFPKR